MLHVTTYILKWKKYTTVNGSFFWEILMKGSLCFPNVYLFHSSLFLQY